MPEISAPRFRITRRHLIWLAPLAGAVLLAVVFALPFALFSARAVKPPAEAVVVIPAGTSFPETAARLEKAGVVTSAERLRLLSKLRGDARQIKAGEYAFAQEATPGEILDRLIAGDVRHGRVTIPEGFSLKEIAGALKGAGFAETDALIRLAGDRAFLKGLGIEASSLEGYIFPDTYAFIPGMPAEGLLRTMVGELKARLTPELTTAAAARGLSVHQLLTLASIIQKEAGNRQEMPLISAVFHNRLKSRMRLQADPTVIYGITGFDGNLTRAHLSATSNPYNTYRIPGLPPGPIASPGLDALRAAAHPAPVDYLYFVACGNGTHVFASTLPEHNRNVQRFQRARRSASP